jgi:hypothetical protein
MARISQFAASSERRSCVLYLRWAKRRKSIKLDLGAIRQVDEALGPFVQVIANAVIAIEAGEVSNQVFGDIEAYGIPRCTEDYCEGCWATGFGIHNPFRWRSCPGGRGSPTLY